MSDNDETHLDLSYEVLESRLIPNTFVFRFSGEKGSGVIQVSEDPMTFAITHGTLTFDDGTVLSLTFAD